MKKLFIVILAIVASVVVSCSGGKPLTNPQQDAEAAYQMGDYQKALTTLEGIIKGYEDAGTQKECPVYYDAALAARQLGQSEKAIEYLKKDAWSNYASADTYYAMATYYQGIDNLSKELEALESYQDKYPQGEQISAVNMRLFEIYVETQNWEMAQQAWPSIAQDASSNQHLLEGWFATNKAIDNDSVCDVLAAELLTLNENNQIALFWMGKKYFWQAENRYKDEMEAYDKNKTNKQYNKLVKALDVVSADFKTSLGYFKTLYTLDPSSRYAKYLGDIYNRLDDKAKADYYYGKVDDK